MEEANKINQAKLRIVSFAVFVLAAVGGFFLLRDYLSLDQLADKQQSLEQFRERNLVACIVLLSLLYIGVAALSLPFATVLTVTYGWFFGFWIALPIVNLSATIGATCSLLVNRYFFRDFVERRYGKHLEVVQRELARDGVLYLFMLRLTPVMPFFIVNPVMGLTSMRARTFFLVSMLGMLPGGALYTFFGSQLKNLAELQDGGWSKAANPSLLIAFALLGIVPIVLKKVARRVAGVERSEA